MWVFWLFSQICGSFKLKRSQVGFYTHYVLFIKVWMHIIIFYQKCIQALTKKFNIDMLVFLQNWIEFEMPSGRKGSRSINRNDSLSESICQIKSSLWFPTAEQNAPMIPTKIFNKMAHFANRSTHLIHKGNSDNYTYTQRFTE